VNLDWISNDAGWVTALAGSLIDAIWQGALIALLYGLVRKSLPTSTHRLWLGYLAMLGFVAAPCMSFLVRLNPSASNADLPSSVSESLTTLATDGTPGLSWPVGVVAVWLFGLSVLAARGTRRWLQLRLVCSEAEPLDAEWQLRVARLHARFHLSVTVAVRQSANIVTPLLIGWIKPVVLLPMGICSQLPVAQLELILAHEFAHVRRFDAWANAIQLLIETLLFYNPAVQWVGRRLREDREVCCDELVTGTGGEPLTYARALLALAELRSANSRSNLALAASGGQLLGRIEQLLGVAPNDQRAPGSLWSSLLLASAPLVAALLLALAAQAMHGKDLVALSPAAPSRSALIPSLPSLSLVIDDVRPVFRLGAALDPSLLVESEASNLGSTRGRTEGARLGRVVEVDRGDEAILSAAPMNARSLDATKPAETPAKPISAAPTALRVLSLSAPEYPSQFVSRGIEGSAELSFLVSGQGKAVDIRIVSATRPAFANAAVAALRNWRFDPAQAGGRRHLQGFDFDFKAMAQGEANCLIRTGSRLCR